VANYDQRYASGSSRKRSLRDAVGGWLRDWYWLLSLILIVASLALGFVGFRIQLGGNASNLDALYKTFKTINLSADVTSPVPWQLEVARFTTPLLFANALILGLGSLFWERFNLLRLLFWRNHVVICGLGKKGSMLAKEFRAINRHVVVIDKSRSNAHRDEFRFRDIILLTGDARDAVLLRRAAVSRAKVVLALTGEDGCNAEIAAVCRTLIDPARQNVPACFAHIADLDLCRFLREREIETLSRSPFRIDYFCIHEVGARLLLAHHPFFDTAPDAVHVRAPHIIIVGPGRFGASLITQAAREWRNAGGSPANRMRVTVIDKSGPQNLERLRVRHPHLDSVCEFQFEALESTSTAFSLGNFLYDAEGACTASAVYITFDGDGVALNAAFAINRRLERSGDSVPVVVRMSEGTGFAAMFTKRDTAAPATNIRAFHLLDETCLPSRLCMSMHDIIAMGLHAEYLAQHGPASPDADPAIAPWEKLPAHLQRSNRLQANHLAERLRACGYQIVPLNDWEAEHYTFEDSEIERMAIMEHDRWCEEKKNAGISYAAGAKTKTTHPGLVPWDKLDEENRERAREIVRAAPRVLANVGFQVERIPRRK